MMRPLPCSVRVLSLALAFALVACVGREAVAQPSVATLAGRVVDVQRMPVSGATVTVRSVATAATWSAASDNEGRFAFPMLSPGTYGVEVSSTGFAPWRAELVTVQVGQDLLLNVQLAVGNIQEGVIVQGDTRPLTTA